MAINPAIIQEGLLLLKEFLTEMEGIPEAIHTIADQVEEFTKNSFSNKQNSQLPSNYHYKKQEFINLEELKELIRTKTPAGANQVATCKQEQPNGSIVLILTFAKDRVLLPNESNQILCLECEHISHDIKNLFGNQDVILIQ